MFLRSAASSRRQNSHVHPSDRKRGKALARSRGGRGRTTGLRGSSIRVPVSGRITSGSVFEKKMGFFKLSISKSDRRAERPLALCSLECRTRASNNQG